jgi:hypothetical protein
MKKITLFLTVQIIFYPINNSTCLPNKEVDKWQRSQELYKKIDAQAVSNKDAQAYTRLIRLRMRMYDHYFATINSYSPDYCKITKQFYDEAKQNAQEIQATEDPAIYGALRATLSIEDFSLPRK